MRHPLEGTPEGQAFFEKGSDRDIAVTLTAVIDKRLTTLLKTFLKKDDKVFEELFRPGAELNNFKTKLKLAYMLNLVHHDDYKDLGIVATIRNKFAHGIGVANFDTEPIKGLVANLKAWTRFSEHRAELQKLYEDTLTVSLPEHETAQLIRNYAKACISVMEITLSDATTRNRFWMCMRLYAWQLAHYEELVGTWPPRTPSPTPAGRLPGG